MDQDRRTPPMLRIVEGPATGRLYPLDRKITMIGRWPGSDLFLDQSTVSKRHAVVERSPGGYYLCDLASLAGTRVNGRPISGPVRLVEGSRFRICDFVFSFSEGIANGDRSEDESTAFATVAASIDPSDPSPDRPMVPPEQKLGVIMDIGRSLGRAIQADEVLDRALDSLFKIFPQAGRGTVFLRAESDGTLTPRVIRSRNGLSNSPAISRTVLDRVIGRREAILSRNSPDDFPDSGSLAYHAIRSLICAPLLDSGSEPLGAIQLDACGLTGRFEAEDLDVLVAVAGSVGLAVENANLHRTAIRQAEQDQELDLARRVLMALLPERSFELAGYQTWSFYEPAKKVGGDYLGAFPIADPGDPSEGPARRWALAVGDVTGHGMPAALFLARLSAEVRLALQGEVDPARCLARLNRQITADAADGFFVTFLMATIDARNHRLTTAGAGHLAPMVRRARGGPIERIGQEAAGLPLAVEEDSLYRSVATTIEPGDVVVLCTDGVYEAINARSELLGLGRLERIILAAPPGASAVGEAIVKAVRDHVGDGPQADDMSILCISRPE